MASVISICNLALSHLGDEATIASIDPPEGSVQAEHCATFYPLARDTMLERHDWRFATRRISLALLDTESWNWLFAYSQPINLVRCAAVLYPTDHGCSKSQDFETETNASGTPIILTNVEDATLRYTVRVEDSTKYPPLFVDALSWLLASYVAGPLLKGSSGQQAAIRCQQQYERLLGMAIASDSNQQQIPRNPVGELAPWLKGR